MIKINPLKQIIFLKSLQYASTLIIFAFLLTFFITSLFISDDIKAYENLNDNFTIGLFNLKFGLVFSYSLSSNAIAYLCVLGIFFTIYIINMFYLKTKFFYLNNYFYFYLIFIISSILFLLINALLSFINVNLNPTNLDNLNNSFNSLISYSIQKYSTSSNLLLFTFQLSVGGITFTIIGSFLILFLFYFPFKITYNLVKIKYI